MIETDSEKLVKRLKKGDEKALEIIIEQYTPFVSTIIFNVSAGKLSTFDIEDTTADVFYTLWKNQSKIIPDKLKGYITSIAKSKAKNKIRDLKKTQDTVDIENVIAIDDYELVKRIEKEDIANNLMEAVKELGIPDSEIIIRYYYYYQSTGKIAEIMGMNKETVKSKIKRGRKKLKNILIERGFTNELL
ncbi:MAG: sigma-70 family RNA polymerase sigma factor [Oscillospiraceae bacterium]|nr:sigma-70 family RNA polymerase sigma factor [Oscillospiraceae bacterium]